MKFSVVIPAYNRSKVVLRAINSVLNQTFQDFEIIVVDDGSEDETKEVVTSIRDERIKYVWQKNQGATIARNTGILHSSGLYVSFLDSDDAWHRNMLEKQSQAYMNDPEVGCVYTDVQVVESDGKKHHFSKPLGACDNSYKAILAQGYMAPTSVVSGKRDLLIEVGMFDKDLPASQDDDMCFKLAKYSKVAFIPEEMADMYVGQINRISVNSDKVARGWWMLWNKYEKDVVSLCGESVMAQHYLECVHHFAVSGDKGMTNAAKRKCLEYGGHMTFLSDCLIKIGFLCPSFRNIRGGRVMRKLLKWSVK